MAVAVASRLCYSPRGIAELEKGWAPGEAEALIRKILSMGHLSVLEHAVFTFGVEGISRATSHQLVRHRLASYSQQSQRYVKAGEDYDYVIPTAILTRDVLRDRFEKHMAATGRLYREFIDAGVPAEDSRYVLPNATQTRIIVTMNARELRHFFSLRCCLRAQWEIREMAERMLGMLRKAAPALFSGAGPDCVSGPCPEKNFSCGLLREARRAYRDWPESSPRPTLPPLAENPQARSGA
jgi:thymidylate synthase (FAD)